MEDPFQISKTMLHKQTLNDINYLAPTPLPKVDRNQLSKKMTKKKKKNSVKKEKKNISLCSASLLTDLDSQEIRTFKYFKERIPSIDH